MALWSATVDFKDICMVDEGKLSFVRRFLLGSAKLKSRIIGEVLSSRIYLENFVVYVRIFVCLFV